MLWIALKFFVLLQSKQLCDDRFNNFVSCELLSNFLYFCSRNNQGTSREACRPVVNCSQIFCTFAVETTIRVNKGVKLMLWIALKFFVLLQSKQPLTFFQYLYDVVNCSQIFCTFAVETTDIKRELSELMLWIALKFFVLLQSKQLRGIYPQHESVVNCSQIFCTFAVETTYCVVKQ